MGPLSVRASGFGMSGWRVRAAGPPDVRSTFFFSWRVPGWGGGVRWRLARTPRGRAGTVQLFDVPADGQNRYHQHQGIPPPPILTPVSCLPVIRGARTVIGRAALRGADCACAHRWRYNGRGISCAVAGCTSGGRRAGPPRAQDVVCPWEQRVVDDVRVITQQFQKAVERSRQLESMVTRLETRVRELEASLRARDARNQGWKRAVNLRRLLLISTRGASPRWPPSILLDYQRA